MALETREQKRLALVFGGGAALAVLFTLVVLFLIGEDDPSAPPEPESYSVSDADAGDLESTALLFLDEAGTYGVRESAVSPETILGLREQISQSPSSEIFLSRRDVYTSLKQNYIAPGSSLDFSTLDDWTDAYLVDNMVTASVEDSTVSVPDEGFVNSDGEPTVRLSVSFTAHQVARWQTATDTSWDGTYDVLDLTIPTTLTLLMEKDSDNVWRVAGVEDLTYRGLLAIVPDPSVDKLPEPQKVGTIKTTIPLPPVNEPTPPVS